MNFHAKSCDSSQLNLGVQNVFEKHGAPVFPAKATHSAELLPVHPGSSGSPALRYPWLIRLPWVNNGFSMGSQWVLNGFSMG